jgi:hypothetical protein
VTAIKIATGAVGLSLTKSAILTNFGTDVRSEIAISIKLLLRSRLWFLVTSSKCRRIFPLSKGLTGVSEGVFLGRVPVSRYRITNKNLLLSPPGLKCSVARVRYMAKRPCQPGHATFYLGGGRVPFLSFSKPPHSLTKFYARVLIKEAVYPVTRRMIASQFREQTPRIQLGLHDHRILYTSSK